jgi:hypothetical protein
MARASRVSLGVAMLELMRSGEREVVEEREDERGSNQLLLKSKKQWSDQWHEEAKRMSRRIEQYTHGRLRK